MGIRQTLIAIGTAAALTVGLGASAHSAELLTNGGFETGDFTGWTRAGNTGNESVSGIFWGIAPHTGAFQAWDGAVGSVFTLSQSFATVVGAEYTVTGWWATRGGTPSSFSASVGVNTFAENPTNPAHGYRFFAFGFTGTGFDTFVISN